VGQTTEPTLAYVPVDVPAAVVLSQQPEALVAVSPLRESEIGGLGGERFERLTVLERCGATLATVYRWRADP
jgi:hypothetical protein